MKTAKLNKDSVHPKDLEAIKATLEKGGVCLLPTDTCYILGAHGLNEAAVRQVFEIKQRPLNNPIHVNIPSFQSAQQWVKITPEARKLARKFLPGPITLVLPKKELVPDILTGGLSTLGIRVPNHWLSLILAQVLFFPYTSTSANLAGEPTPYTLQAALSQLDEKRVALAIDVGPLPPRPTSTVVDLTHPSPRILRTGPITQEEIESVLGKNSG